MNVSRVLVRHAFRAVLAAAVLVPVARAADDVVKEEPEAAPAPVQPGRVFGGQLQGGRVIIMPGLRLQVGGQGQVQVQAGNVPAAAAADGPKESYLGVVTAPVAPQVRAQLELPEGVGLSIDAVAAGGPAAKAGVRQFDVIHKFNDQVVCSPEQLTTLVKVAGAGTKVPLTLLRGGREKVVEAVLEERVVAPEAEAEDAVVGALPGVLDLRQMVGPGLVPGGIDPRMQADIERKVAEALARAGAGGLLPGVVPGAQLPGVVGNVHTQVLTIGPNAQSATVVSDARGTVEIRSADGKKTVTVKDPEGTEVHAGPLDTDEDLAKVPEEYRDWVREVDGGQAVVEPLEPEAEAPQDESPQDEAAEKAATGPTI